eukprot:265413_1
MAHTYDRAELEKQFRTNLENGLSEESATKLLRKYGHNELTPPKYDPWWLQLCKSICGGFFNIFLWIASILCFVAYIIDDLDVTNLYLAIVLAVVCIVTGVCEYLYYVRASTDLMGSLSRMKPRNLIVTRSGRKMEIEPRDLVPGDVCHLTLGMALPADVRIIDCTPDMEVDNSSLTGESEPQKRDWKPSNDTPSESRNLCFFGTLVVNGRGTGVVIFTGDDTFMGRTAQLAVSADIERTLIAKEMKDLVRKVGTITFSLAISFFILGMMENQNVWANVVLSIGIIVAGVPEGLLATTTIILSLSARRLFNMNVRVKNLESVETLGSISVICSDKTGTLTTNVMTCQHVYYNLKECDCDTENPMRAVTGDFYQQNNGKKRSPDLMKLIRCGALCNNAQFVFDGQVDMCSDATEAAIVKFCYGHVVEEYHIGVPEYRRTHTKLHEIPFNSRNKWQVSIHELPTDFVLETEEKQCSDKEKTCLVQMKGAPERVLPLCDRYVKDGEVLDLNADIRYQILDSVMSWGSRGERVVAYDVNVIEPLIERRGDDDVDESLMDQDAVVVGYLNEKFLITLDGIRDDDGAIISFDDLYIKHLMHAIQQYLGVPVPAQRLGFSDF